MLRFQFNSKVFVVNRTSSVAVPCWDVCSSAAFGDLRLFAGKHTWLHEVDPNFIAVDDAANIHARPQSLSKQLFIGLMPQNEDEPRMVTAEIFNVRRLPGPQIKDNIVPAQIEGDRSPFRPVTCHGGLTVAKQISNF